MVIDFQELDAAIGRREEWMASEVLFKGTVTCLDGDTNEVVAELTYGAPTKTVPAKLWGPIPLARPFADLRAALRLVSSACGASADIVIMGRSAADSFEAHEKVLSAYDKLRISPGTLAPASAGWGIQSLGTYRGIPLYVYEAEYQNAAGTLTRTFRPTTSDRCQFARRINVLRWRQSSGRGRAQPEVYAGGEFLSSPTRLWRIIGSSDSALDPFRFRHSPSRRNPSCTPTANSYSRWIKTTPRKFLVGRNDALIEVGTIFVGVNFEKGFGPAAFQIGTPKPHRDELLGPTWVWFQFIDGHGSEQFATTLARLTAAIAKVHV